MDFLSLAENRYSVRKFDPRPVEKEDMQRILRAGQVAPTACNNQPQRILALTEPESLQRLRRCTKCHFDAPAALLVCYDKTCCWTREYDGKTSGDIDASIVCTHMMLEAASLGVGTTWVMYFIPEAIREELSLPPELEPTALLVMGYPAEGAQPSPMHLKKNELSETVSFERF